MSLPIEVPGLDTVVPSVEDGTVLIVEGGSDLAKSYFVRQLCRTASRLPRPVTFVTSGDEEEVHDRLAREGGSSGPSSPSLRVLERDALKGAIDLVGDGGLLAVDSFSFLTIELDATDLARMLRGLRRSCRERNAIAVLATDQGMFEPRAEAVVTHLAEGHVEFHAQEGPEGVVRFLRVPKWADGRFVDRNIYYTFDGRRIAVDLRNRVL